MYSLANLGIMRTADGLGDCGTLLKVFPDEDPSNAYAYIYKTVSLSNISALYFQQSTKYRPFLLKMAAYAANYHMHEALIPESSNRCCSKNTAIV